MGAVDEGLWLDGPTDAACTLVLAHGAGAPADSPFLEQIARAIAGAGIRVVRFEFPYMHARRAGGRRGVPDREPVLRSAWLEVVERLGGGPRLVIGGKSLGGRIAAAVADEAGARGVVCLGFPFHPPRAPARLRTAALAAPRVPTLIVQGTRDAFGTREEVAGYALSPAVRVHWIEGGDHSLVRRPAGGGRREPALAEATEVVVAFVRGLQV
jgi:predicted alpha/beta-hydrolase family hydrolase